MTKPQIKDTKDLPPYFALSKYEDAKTLTTYGWANELQIRACIIGELQATEDPSRFKPHVAHIPDRPLNPERYGLPTIHVLDEGGYSVYSLDFGWLAFFYQILSRDPDVKATLTDPNLDYDHSLVDIAVRKAGAYFIDDIVSLIVDLNASDKQITHDFHAWLKNIRGKIKVEDPEAGLLKNKFQDWAKFQILPYLDLKAWAIANNTSIAQHVYGSALYPEEPVNTAERVSKTLRKKADLATESTVIYALYMQAAADQKSANIKQSDLPEK